MTSLINSLLKRKPKESQAEKLVAEAAQCALQLRINRYVELAGKPA